MIVDFDWDFNNSQPFPIGLPQNFGTRAHVSFKGVDRLDCSPRIGTESALGISHFSVMTSTEVRELRNDTNPETAVPRDSTCGMRIQKAGPNAHVGLAFGHRSNNHRYQLRPMLAIPVKDHKDVRSILSSVSEAGPDRGAVPPVHGVSNNVSPCQGRGVRRIVCRAIVNDDNLTRELSRS